jgi:hypothetical protein
MVEAAANLLDNNTAWPNATNLLTSRLRGFFAGDSGYNGSPLPNPPLRAYRLSLLAGPS